MKKVLIHTLLKSYSLLVIGIVIFFASILSYISEAGQKLANN
ncbi:hypothetical protein ACTGVP_09160 [Streptococcus suis]